MYKNLSLFFLIAVLLSCNKNDDVAPTNNQIPEGSCLIKTVGSKDTIHFEYKYDGSKLIWSTQRTPSGYDTAYYYYTNNELSGYKSMWQPEGIVIKSNKGLVQSAEKTYSNGAYISYNYVYTSDGLLQSEKQFSKTNNSDSLFNDYSYYYQNGNVVKSVNNGKTKWNGQGTYTTFSSTINYYYDDKKNYLEGLKGSFPNSFYYFNKNNVIRYDHEEEDEEDYGPVIYEYNKEGYPAKIQGIDYEFSYICN